MQDKMALICGSGSVMTLTRTKQLRKVNEGIYLV